MTANQISFARHKEDARHNKVVEAETSRHNVQQEGIGWADVRTKQDVYREQVRHNLADEDIRSALAQAQTTYWDATGEAALRNAATNAYNASTNYLEYEERLRHQLVSEGIDQQRADAIAQQAAAAIRQAEISNMRRKDEKALGWAGLASGLITSGTHELSSLARSIIRNGGRK